VGRITGINDNQESIDYDHYTYKPAKVHRRCSKVWVPRYTWEEIYVPEHEEYSQEYGKIIVGAHYIRYQVERGGKWVHKNCHHKNYGQRKKYHH
jgi:hypothetical protein